MNLMGDQITLPRLSKTGFSIVGLSIACLSMLTACAQSSETENGPATASEVVSEGVVSEGIVTASGDTEVARFDGGALTAEDLDRAILRRGLASQVQEAENRAEWLTQLARRLAVERILLEEARLVGADQDPEMQRAERQARRQVHSENYLRLFTDQLPPVPDQEIADFYQEHLDRYQRPERRRVQHIFKRYGEGLDRAALTAELTALRDRVVQGESFGLLAREHSDSETRHRDGSLGEVKRGIFPEDFDQVVFALEQGVPSEPVFTADGGHLFFVSTVLEARSFELDDVKALIRRELEGQRRSARLAELADDLPLPQDSFVPNQQERLEILRAGDARALVLRVGDFQLTASELQAQIKESRRLLGADIPKDLPKLIFEDILHREIIYQHLVREGLPEIQDEMLQSHFDQALMDHFSRRKMTSWVERSPEKIQTYFELHKMRYATPIRISVERLMIPRDRVSPEVMASLEQAKTDLDDGRLDLKTLAERHGGEVIQAGSLTAAALERVDPSALRFAFVLRPGEHSPPYSVGKSLVIFKVTERRDPEPQALALVRDRVVQDYLAANSGQIFRQMSDELLAEANFQLVV